MGFQEEGRVLDPLGQTQELLPYFTRLPQFPANMITRTQSKQSGEERFTPREGIIEPKLQELIEMSQEEFSTRFRKSPIKRTKLSGLKRNAEAVEKGYL